MLVGVGKETWPDERRVALVPGLVPGLKKAGLDVVVEAGAGVRAGFPDEEYRAKGATRRRPRRGRPGGHAASGALARRSRRRSRPPGIDLVRQGQTVIGFLDPLGAPAGVLALNERGAASLAMELIPRITRAQSMDALSSTANIVGLQSSAPGRPGAAPHVPDVDDRGGDGGFRQGFRRGGRGGGALRHRHRPAPWRHRRGLRRAPGGQGAGPEPGAQSSSSFPWKPPKARGDTPGRWTKPSIGSSGRR